MLRRLVSTLLALVLGSVGCDGPTQPTAQPAFASLSAGWDFACRVTAAGAAFCWGDGVYGELGTGDTLSQLRPTPVAGGVQFAAVQAGTSHSCGVTGTGATYCWGWNELSQLGEPPTYEIRYRTSPTLVVAGVRFVAVTVGAIHTCGLAAAGAAYCWGSNGRGQLGRGIDLNIDTVSVSAVPLAVSGGLSFATVTSGGGDHTCGLTAAGVAYCWGVNIYGEIGDGTTGTDRPSPVRVTGGLTFAALSTGSAHTCGVTLAGDVFCWGVNFTGQLGDGTTTHRSNPVPVAGGLKFTAVSAGPYSDHTCALSAAGAAYCWGYNNNGQLGDGTTIDHLTPVPVTGGLTFASVTVGASYTCGLTLSGDAYCWGYNGYGRLGDGTTTDRHMPTRVKQ
jgi:alpha-tubulin suppressor-like RCC1 family protein